jgi:predicted nucleic acid-binding protein
VAIVTHARIYKPPTPVDRAISQVDAWLESPSLVLIGESEGHWRALRELLVAGKVSGPPVHDARIAALCVTHGVRTLWTADRDFSRFPTLNAVNPLVAG